MPTVEECRLVALVAQHGADAAHVVERGGGEEEWLDHHGQAGQDAGHGVHRDAPVGIAVLPCETALQQRVDKGHVATIAAAIELGVERADVLLAHALDDEDDHVLAGM